MEKKSRQIEDQNCKRRWKRCENRARFRISHTPYENIIEPTVWISVGSFIFLFDQRKNFHYSLSVTQFWRWIFHSEHDQMAGIRIIVSLFGCFTCSKTKKEKRSFMQTVLSSLFNCFFFSSFDCHSYVKLHDAERSIGLEQRLILFISRLHALVRFGYSSSSCCSSFTRNTVWFVWTITLAAFKAFVHLTL